MSEALELVREMKPWKAGQELALYRQGSEYMVVSTVNLSQAFLGGYATAGEETMAFAADEQGEVTDWGELACANGEGSRADVIEQLASGHREARW
jgi:hypothetical protein